MFPLPQTRSEISLVAWWTLYLVAAIFFLGLIVNRDVASINLLWAAGFLALGGLAFGIGVFMVNGGRVDPWRLQRKLMQISDQALPPKPELSRDSMLYFALCIEELGELSRGMVGALDRWAAEKERERSSPNPNSIWSHQPGSLRRVRNHLDYFASSFQRDSKDFRAFLAQLHYMQPIELTREEAKEILDGTTDLAVTNAGLANSTGLPGAEAYSEVQSSNLSKANPASGKIDKWPDGKWIKGENYRAPDLDLVLDQHEMKL